MAFVFLIKQFDFLIRISIKWLRQAKDCLSLFILERNRNKNL